MMSALSVPLSHTIRLDDSHRWHRRLAGPASTSPSAARRRASSVVRAQRQHIPHPKPHPHAPSNARAFRSSSAPVQLPILAAIGYWCAEGARAPQPCEAGRFGVQPQLGGPDECTACPAPTWSLRGASSCTLCQGNFYPRVSSAAAASSSDAPTLAPIDDFECVACPLGASCTGLTLFTLDLRAGYWRLTTAADELSQYAVSPAEHPHHSRASEPFASCQH